MDMVINFLGYLLVGYLSIRFLACFYKNYAATTKSKTDDVRANKIWNIVKSLGVAIKDTFSFRKGIK